MRVRADTNDDIARLQLRSPDLLSLTDERRRTARTIQPVPDRRPVDPLYPAGAVEPPQHTSLIVRLDDTTEAVLLIARRTRLSAPVIRDLADR